MNKRALNMESKDQGSMLGSVTNQPVPMEMALLLPRQLVLNVSSKEDEVDGPKSRFWKSVIPH